MDHAIQQIDAEGVMVGISQQWYEEAKAKLAAYEDAEEQGRLIVLGDTKYCNTCRFKLQSDAWKFYTYPCSWCAHRTKSQWEEAALEAQKGGAE